MGFMRLRRLELHLAISRDRHRQHPREMRAICYERTETRE